MCQYQILSNSTRAEVRIHLGVTSHHNPNSYKTFISTYSKAISFSTQNLVFNAQLCCVLCTVKGYLAWYDRKEWKNMHAESCRPIGLRVARQRSVQDKFVVFWDNTLPDISCNYHYYLSWHFAWPYNTSWFISTVWELTKISRQGQSYIEIRGCICTPFLKNVKKTPLQ
jgi:hypothetical protein